MSAKTKDRRYWIVLHENGNTWPTSFSFWRHLAIRKFLTEIRMSKPEATWPIMRRMGFRVIAVKLSPYPDIGSGDGLGPVVLCLPLTFYWYDKTKHGGKRIEYREMTERWRKQIWDKRERITDVRFSRGYTSRTLTRSVERIDIGPCPIPGWAGEYYRIHFGPPNIAMSHGASEPRTKL